MNNSYDMVLGVRRSALWEMRKSPAHYLYAVQNPPKETPSLLFGTAAHKYVLETDDFWDSYILAPEVDRRTKEGKTTWQEYITQLEESGKASVSISDYNTILDMNASILQNPTASILLKTGVHEVPVQWVDPGTGEFCKCRPDCLTQYKGEKYIVDYKTTTSCEDGHFERSCRYYGYKLQAAMYVEGLFQSTLESYKFAFVAQEKNPPYAVRVYFCDQGFIDEGMEIYRTLMDKYHECVLTGEWPGYADGGLYGDE